MSADTYPAAPNEAEKQWPRVRRWVVPVAVVAVIAVMLHVLQHEAAHLRYHDIMRALRELPRTQVVLAALCTLLSYAVLPGYDLLALEYAGHRLPLRRIAYGSVVAYGLSQTLGFPAFTGGSVRVRLWSAWGLENEEIARALAFANVSFALGIVGLTAGIGLTEPTSSLQRLHLSAGIVRGLAAVGLLFVLAYVGWCIRARGRIIRVWRAEIPAPRLRLVAGQFLVAALDWMLAALVLYVLLPSGHEVRFPAFVAVFVLAHAAGLLSHVPGGLGVFEILMVLQFGDAMPVDRLLGSLLAYRVVFYLLPFVAAIGMLAAHEAWQQRQLIHRTTAAVAEGFTRWAEPLMPSAIGTMAVIGGVMLLISGATPAVGGRIGALIDVLPLGVVELSHFAASLAGTGLVILGWALTRRLDAGWHLARALLVIGIVASLLKGLDYEEATVLAVLLALLQAGRRAFYRKSSLLAEPMTPGWIVAIVTVVGVSVWVGLFTYKHLEYSSELWWRFAERGDAPRFLRASAGAAALLGVVGAMRLLRHAPARLHTATVEELQIVARLLPRLDDSAAALALLGDKHLMIADSGDGFLMYGVSGRSWVALGDPFGPEAVQRELAWRFREAADEHGGWPVFYEVSARHLPLYIDLGLTLLKMGEEAIVPLGSFSLEGGGRKGLRRTRRDLQNAGASFTIVPPSEVPALLDDLRVISDEWLTSKSTREKRFSLGRFDPSYLVHFPLALVKVKGRLVAFANLWTGSGREVSVDLMRYSPDAPSGVMEYLFIELMTWGRENGFERMSLGMAPLSGLEARALAPRWHRFGGMLYRHGEHFYNFQGLRRYKEKFDPVWEPRYLATPAGLALPRVLSNVASLISGGITGLLTR